MLLVENTKGLVTGALVERGAKGVIRIEMENESLKMKNDILLEFNFHSYQPKGVTYINFKKL